MGVAEALLVVRVSNSAGVRAWIWRWMAAGFRPVRVSFIIVLSWALPFFVSLRAAVGRRGDVVLLRDLGAVADLGD